ncbi:hypothetical protein AURDEDRAFT_67506, partial [Auricularia subglabra TFB-10046 SS5]
MNKLLTNARDVDSHVLILGRAIMITFEWHAGDHITVLAVYVPTDKAANAQMWAQIDQALYDRHPRLARPDIILGDFNFVEDPVDRYPAGLNAIDAPASFADLKRTVDLIDGWRNTFPGTVEWTWRNSARSAMSRIDRIYLSRTLNSRSREWKISITGITKDDHSRVQTDITHAQAPASGPGRWTMAHFLVQDHNFMDGVNTKGMELHRAMTAITLENRSAERNVQKLWHSYKQEVTRMAKERMHQINCK